MHKHPTPVRVSGADLERDPAAGRDDEVRRPQLHVDGVDLAADDRQDVGGGVVPVGLPRPVVRMPRVRLAQGHAKEALGGRDTLAHGSGVQDLGPVGGKVPQADEEVHARGDRLRGSLADGHVQVRYDVACERFRIIYTRVRAGRYPNECEKGTFQSWTYQ